MQTYDVCRLGTRCGTKMRRSRGPSFSSQHLSPRTRCCISSSEGWVSILELGAVSPTEARSLLFSAHLEERVQLWSNMVHKASPANSLAYV